MVSASLIARLLSELRLRATISLDCAKFCGVGGLFSMQNENDQQAIHIRIEASKPIDA
jgi:hypothetical protein